MNNSIIKRSNRRDYSILYLSIDFIGFLLFYIWPFIVSLGYAFMDRPVHGTFVGIQNFIELFQNKPYLLGAKNTFWFIGISVPLSLFISLMMAILTRRFKNYKTLFTLAFLIPLVIPSGSMVFFWKALFAKQGYINSIMTSIGLMCVDWLGTSTVLYVIILIFIWKNLGYNMILFGVGLHNIPKEYYEAAAIDGANALQVFFCITLPKLMPMIVLVTIMSIINSFKMFKEVYLLTGAYPHESIYMLQHFMNNMFYALNYPKLTTATCIMVLITTLLVYFLLWFERKHGE